jgi:hypothetical protein
LIAHFLLKLDDEGQRFFLKVSLVFDLV